MDHECQFSSCRIGHDGDDTGWTNAFAVLVDLFSGLIKAESSGHAAPPKDTNSGRVNIAQFQLNIGIAFMVCISWRVFVHTQTRLNQRRFSSGERHSSRSVQGYFRSRLNLGVIKVARSNGHVDCRLSRQLDGLGFNG